MATRTTNDGSNWLGCGCLVMLFAVGGILAVVKNNHKETITATVVDKGIKRTDKDTDTYLIYTNAGTLQDHDELLQSKFNSSDLYGSIQVGHTYKFNCVGWRNQYMSMYPNIVTVEEVKK